MRHRPAPAKTSLPLKWHNVSRQQESRTSGLVGVAETYPFTIFLAIQAELIGTTVEPIVKTNLIDTHANITLKGREYDYSLG